MEENIAKHRKMMEFCQSHLTHNIFNYCMRRFFFVLVNHQARINTIFNQSLDMLSLKGKYNSVSVNASHMREREQQQIDKDRRREGARI